MQHDKETTRTADMDDGTPVGPMRQSPRRIRLLAAAGIIGASDIYDWVDGRAGLAVGRLLSRGLPPTFAHVRTAVFLQEILWLMLALIALGLAARADGARAMGLMWRGSRAWQVRTVGLCIVIPSLAQGVVQIGALIVHFGASPTEAVHFAVYSVIHGADGMALWYVDFHSTVAGIGEEVLVLALAWRLLEYIPWRLDGRRFVFTGLCTVVLVALRLPYHMVGAGPSLAAKVPMVIAWTWATVWLYRTTRMVIPLIVAHIAWDMTTTGWWLAGYMLVGIGCLAITVHPAGTRSVFGGKPRGGRKVQAARFRWHHTDIRPGESVIPQPRRDG